MAKNLYLTSTESDSHKKIITLGLIEFLLRNIEKVAYFKPIIHVSEKKSVADNFALVKKQFNLDIPDEQMYAYTFDEAEKLVSSGKYDQFIEGIISRYKSLEERFDFVLCEGTDFDIHTSSFEMDLNSRIASALLCPVLIVTPAHNREIYNIIQSLTISNESFLARKCSVIGAVVTRVPEDRCIQYLDILREQEQLKKLSISVIPESAIINTPSMVEIARHLKATVLFGEEQMNKQVNRYSIGGMHLENYLWGLSDGTVIITTGDRVDIILGSLLINQSLNFPEIAGIVLTVEFVIDNMVLQLIEGLPSSLPILVVTDTITGTVSALDNLKPDILPENTTKIQTALSLFDTHIDMQALGEVITNQHSEKVTPKMFEYGLIQQAKSQKRHIVLPEGEEDRILRATEALLARDIVNVTLLGNEEKIRSRASELGLDLRGARIVDPETSDLTDTYADTLYEMRKKKGMTPEEARNAILDVSYFGTMMVHMGDADGMVSGAVHSTAATIRPSLQIIKTKPDTPIVSSVFLMCLEDRVLVYGDCAVNTNPDAESLAHIAISSAETGKTFGVEPRVALLSYSTGTSGSGEDVERVRTATEKARELRPDLKIEGPIQYDAAVSRKVAATKMPDSEVAGRATVFIFPDLNTGNNTYKAVQRETGAIAIGPILQGLNKPVNDLSRGCTIPDIINTVIITAIQSQNN